VNWKTSRAAGAVLALYAKGVSVRDISGFILEMYAMEISATEISHITDCVIPMLNEWRTRPLEAVYPFVFPDCIHYKVRENGTVKSRAIYNILGVNREGKKELLGVCVSENEGAKFCGAARAAVSLNRLETERSRRYIHCVYRRSEPGGRSQASPRP